MASEDQIRRLEDAAEDAMKNAYTPMSNFSVGAAVLTESGKIYAGCNTESIVDIGTCAERNAINNAVTDGEYRFSSILITSEQESPLRPCGSCLQYIFEFSQVAEHDIEIVLKGRNGKTEISTVQEMLPQGVGPENLELDLDQYRDDGNGG